MRDTASLDDAVRIVRRRAELEPRVALVLDGWMDGLARAIEVEESVPFAEIPGFSDPGAEPHDGRLLLGRLEGVTAVAMVGRPRREEGHSPARTALAVRVMRFLATPGGEPPPLLVCDTCDALDPLWEVGELVLVEDHINLTAHNPLVGPNLDALGPRFPDMSEAYAPELSRIAVEAARESGIPLRRGVYVALARTDFVTPAEARMLRRMGGDLVGAATVPETLVARHMGMRVLALAVVAGRGIPALPEHGEGSERRARAAGAGSALARIVRDVVARLPGPAGEAQSNSEQATRT